jgi:hypothetical protein
MRNRFRMGRALTRLLSSALPIGQRLSAQPCLRIVVGHQLGLHHRHLRKLCLQGLGNPLVVVLARAPQQGRIGRLLDQGMLEDVRGLGADTPLIEQFGVDKSAQILT